MRAGDRDVAWVHVAGELDIATCSSLERALRAAELRAPLVILDLRRLAFADILGVRVILYASARAHRAGRRLVVVRGRSLDRVLEVTGAAEHLAVVELVAADQEFLQPVQGATAA